MILKKGLKRDLLLLLGILDDIHRDYFSYRESLLRMAWGDGYSRKSTYQSYYRMAKTGEIEKEIINGEPVLKITAKGNRLLNESIPMRRLAKKRWDKCWRMVIFDIPEEKRIIRDRLRNKLISLSFAMWQRSIYVTPHDVLREFGDYLVEKKYHPECVCIVARRHDFGDDRALASRVFKLDELNRKYLDLRDDFESFQLEVGEGLGEKKTVTKFKGLWDDYQEILLADPCLPRELLPADWCEGDAREAFKDLAKTIGKRLARKLMENSS